MADDAGHDTVGAAQVGSWLRAFATAVTDNAAELTALDSAIGDAAPGAHKRRGKPAGGGKLDPPPDAQRPAGIATGPITWPR